MRVFRDICRCIRKLLGLKKQMLLEEAGVEDFHKLHWYPAAPGLLLFDRFRLIAKLGRGAISTIWLARVPEDGDRYSVFKMPCLEDHRAEPEWQISKLLWLHVHEQYRNEADFRQEPFPFNLRIAFDLFNLSDNRYRSNLPHKVLVYEPAGPSANQIRHRCGGRMPSNMLRKLVKDILVALDFLHNEARMVHLDLHAGNVLSELTDAQRTCANVERAERHTPSQFRDYGQTTVFASKPMECDITGKFLLTDFGSMRKLRGQDVGGLVDALPDLSRAPETIFRCAASEKLDIWALGIMIWFLYCGEQLISYEVTSRHSSELEHCSWVVAICGQPSADDFAWIQTGESELSFYDSWDEYQRENLGAQTGAPYRDLEEAERMYDVCEDGERPLFLAFLRRMLQWRPDQRALAQELLSDQWLMIP